MTITTKYNVGDTLFFIDGSGVRKKKVARIEIELVSASMDNPIARILITYHFYDDRGFSVLDICKYESEVADSKEALIKQLPELE